MGAMKKLNLYHLAMLTIVTFIRNSKQSVMSEINFLHPQFKTEVTSSCVAEDDYQPSNLVSAGFWEKDRGFMAYNLVKPPVKLTFNFKYKIQVNRIKLWPSMGSQRSTSFEIDIINGKESIQVGKCNRMNADIVEWSKIDCSPATSSSCLQLKFFSSNAVRKSLQGVDCMQVTITSTQRCAVVLRKIEIWGYPSRKLDSAAKQECEDLWRGISTPNLSNCKKARGPTETRKHSTPSNIENVPEEFLDAITCELMLFPTRLPCGKAVDQSTIEKHSRIEESWGRVPSDPFTGKPFTANSKPILDATLKTRIDKFLIENSHRPEFKNVPRTLGRKTPVQTQNNTKLESNYLNPDPPAKKPKLDLDVKPTLSVIPLHEAFQSALESIRQRAVTRSSSNKAAEEKKCISCSGKGYLYKIKGCDHIICRTCLHRIRDSQMCTCKAKFSNSDVERIFE